MLELDEGALICDLAETYNIYDYMSLPVPLVATLAAGLRENSRIKMKAANAPAGFDTLLLAVIADRIEAFRYGFTSDSSKGKNKPVSIVEAIYGGNESNKTGVASFTTVEQFEAALTKIRGD